MKGLPVLRLPMDLVNILMTLRRRRRLVVAAALLSIAAGAAVGMGVAPVAAPKKPEGTGVARVLVDTPRSVVVGVNPRGSEFLGARANVLANVMVEGEVKDAIARRAGVPPKRLFAHAESTTGADIQPAIPEDRKFILVTRVLNDDTGEQLPIIEMETEAPNAQRAAALANAAVEGLQKYLDSKATDEAIPDERRLFVSPLGDAQAADVVPGASLIAGVAVALFLFLAFCGAIVMASAVSGGMRRAAAGEAGLTPPPAAPEVRLDAVPAAAPRPERRVRSVPSPDADAELQLLRRDLAS